MPAGHGLLPGHLQSVQHARCLPIQPGKYQTVHAGEAKSLRRFTSQHVELMTKRQYLYLQRRSRPEQSDQRQPNQAANTWGEDIDASFRDVLSKQSRIRLYALRAATHGIVWR